MALNVDVRLSHHQAEHSANRPNQANLSSKIQSLRNSYDKASYVNNSPDAFPTDRKDALTFLGMQYNITTNIVYMTAKPLLLRSKIKSNTVILIKNPLKFETLINSASLSKA